MKEVEKAAHETEGANEGRPKQPAGEESPPRRIVVDKRTHRVRLENETESEVTVVIEEKWGRR